MAAANRVQCGITKGHFAAIQMPLYRLINRHSQVWIRCMAYRSVSTAAVETAKIPYPFFILLYTLAGSAKGLSPAVV
jgi:hypothetical protein